MLLSQINSAPQLGQLYACISSPSAPHPCISEVSHLLPSEEATFTVMLEMGMLLVITPRMG